MSRRAAAARWAPRACLLLCVSKAADAAANLAADAAPSVVGTRGLGFTHVPCNFGHTVEEVGLGKGVNATEVMMSIATHDVATQIALMEDAVRPGHGEVWSMFNPLLRGLSNVTGCNLYYTPPKHWPKGLAEAYYGNRKVFGVLRDPYDKLANEFRMQVRGVDSVFLNVSRRDISIREGHLEREGERYQRYYRTCDVNGYLKEELRKVKAGDRFRVNCHMLPQAEYYEGPHGIQVTIDNRRLPDSFNELVAKHGYTFRIEQSIHNEVCDNISAYSLDEETKALIREVYARDFELVCEHYGYCDNEEITCMEQIPDMCGGKPDGVEAFV